MAKKIAKKVAKKTSKPVAKKKKLPIKKAVAKKPVAKKAPAKKVLSKPVKKKAIQKAKPAPVKNKKKVVAKTPTKKIEKTKKAPAAPKKVAKPVGKPTPKVKIEKPVAEIVPVKEAKVAKAPKIKPPKPKKIIKTPIFFKEDPNRNSVKKNEPKGKYELEFVIKSSPSVLFDFVSTTSGIQEWFADNVTLKGDVQTFHWDGSTQDAIVVDYAHDEFIRYQWLDKNDGSYFEFRIQIDELTNDVSLIVTDFAENEAERKSASLLWESQVHKLMKVIGSGA